MGTPTVAYAMTGAAGDVVCGTAGEKTATWAKTTEISVSIVKCELSSDSMQTPTVALAATVHAPIDIIATGGLILYKPATIGSWVCWRTAVAGAAAPQAQCSAAPGNGEVQLTGATTGAEGGTQCTPKDVFTAVWTAPSEAAVVSAVECSIDTTSNASALLVMQRIVVYRLSSVNNWLCWRSATVFPVLPPVCGEVGASDVLISATTTGLAGMTSCGVADSFSAIWIDTSEMFVSIIECAAGSTAVDVAVARAARTLASVQALDAYTTEAAGRILYSSAVAGSWLCWSSGSDSLFVPPTCGAPGADTVSISAGTTGRSGASHCAPVNEFGADWADLAETYVKVATCTGDGASSVVSPGALTTTIVRVGVRNSTHYDWGVLPSLEARAGTTPKRLAFVWKPNTRRATAITLTASHQIWATRSVNATLCTDMKPDGTRIPIAEVNVAYDLRSIEILLTDLHYDSSSAFTAAEEDISYTIECEGNLAPHPGPGSIVRFQLRTSTDVEYDPVDLSTSEHKFEISGIPGALLAFSVVASPSPTFFGSVPNSFVFTFTARTNIPSGGSVVLSSNTEVWAAAGDMTVTGTTALGSFAIAFTEASPDRRSITVHVGTTLAAALPITITCNTNLAKMPSGAGKVVGRVKFRAKSSMDVVYLPELFSNAIASSNAAALQVVELLQSVSDHTSFFETGLITVAPGVATAGAEPGTIAFTWRSKLTIFPGSTITITSNTAVWGGALDSTECTSLQPARSPRACLARECPRMENFEVNDWTTFPGNDRIVYCDPTLSPHTCKGRMENHVSSRRFPNAIATYFCRPGFRMVGATSQIESFSRPCAIADDDAISIGAAASAKWGLAPPVCVARKCPLLPKPDRTLTHRIMSYSRSRPEYNTGPYRTVGDMVTYPTNIFSPTIAYFKCDEGFVGSGERACANIVGIQSDRDERVEWTEEVVDSRGRIAPQCLPTLCPGLPSEIALGSMVWTEENPYGVTEAKRSWHSRVDYACDDGYVLIGPQTRRCEDNRIEFSNVGTWSVSIDPFCVPSICGALEEPEDGYVTYSSNDYSFNSTSPLVAQYHCDIGFQMNSPVTRVCNQTSFYYRIRGVNTDMEKRGTVGWTNETKPACRPTQCIPFNDDWLDMGVHKGVPVSVIGRSGRVEWLTPEFGDQLFFNCSDKRALTEGPKSPTCNVDGVWESGVLGSPSETNKIRCECPAGGYMINENVVTVDLVTGLNVTLVEEIGYCRKCPTNYIGPTAGAVGPQSCQRCKVEIGERSISGDIACHLLILLCPEGTYKDKTNTKCISCPTDGALCFNNEIELLPAWWHDGDWVDKYENGELSRDSQVLPCLNDACCIIDQNSTSVSCAFGYESVLCGACDLKGLGYIRNGIVCTKCDPWFINMVVSAYIAASYVSYILYVVAFQDFSSESDQRPVVLKIAMSFSQMLSVLGIFKARGTEVFNEIVQGPAKIAGGGVSSAVNLKCFLNSQIYGAFIMNMFTPPIAAILTIILIAPVAIGKKLEWAVVNSSPAARPPREIVNIFFKRRTILPWEKGMMQQVLDNEATARFQPVGRFIAVLVFVLFGVYPTLVSSIFEIFRCTEPISGKRYLEEDLSVECYVGWHPSFALFGIFCAAFYLFGIPFSMAYILQTNRHRLREPQFIATYGFIYSGYHIDRGVVSAWESLVMVRKLTITAITISTSDPYLQIFMALTLLIISYGLQERVKPYNAPILNTLEGAALFSLIFTQVVSILYLYIDTQTKATGKTDKPFEYTVTVLLIGVNACITAALGLAYLNAWWGFMEAEKAEFSEWILMRDEPYGLLSDYENPRQEPPEQLFVYRAMRDVIVYTEPYLGAEVTGEIMEEGDIMLIDEQEPEYAREAKLCAPGRPVLWNHLVDGTGWVVNKDMASGEDQIRLVDREDDNGTRKQAYWRFEVVGKENIPIRCGTSSDPFVWPTGEVLVPGETVHVDKRFQRTEFTYYAFGDKSEVTFLHLADGRGWVVEPSRVPDTDWIRDPDYVDHSIRLRLVGQELFNAALGSDAVSEYEAIQPLVIFRTDDWPPERHAELESTTQAEIVRAREYNTLAVGTRFFVTERHTVHTRWQHLHITLPFYGLKHYTFPRSFNYLRKVGRFATFLKLADSRGYVLVMNRATETLAARFISLRYDSIDDDDGEPLLRYYLRVSAYADPVEVHPTLEAAVKASQRSDMHKRLMDNLDGLSKLGKLGEVLTKKVEAIVKGSYYPPLMPGDKVVISERHDSRTPGKFGFDVTVGKLADGLGYTGWVILDTHGDRMTSQFKILGVDIAHRSDGTFTKRDIADGALDDMHEVALSLSPEEVAQNTAERHFRVWREKREHNATITLGLKRAAPHWVGLGKPVDGVHENLWDISSCSYHDLPEELRVQRYRAALESWESLLAALESKTLRELKSDAAFLDAASATQHMWWWTHTHDEQAVPYKFLNEEERQGCKAQTRATLQQFEVECKLRHRQGRLAEVQLKWEEEAAKPRPLRSMRRKKQRIDEGVVDEGRSGRAMKRDAWLKKNPDAATNPYDEAPAPWNTAIIDAAHQSGGRAARRADFSGNSEMVANPMLRKVNAAKISRREALRGESSTRRGNTSARNYSDSDTIIGTPLDLRSQTNPALRLRSKQRGESDFKNDKDGARRDDSLSGSNPMGVRGDSSNIEHRVGPTGEPWTRSQFVAHYGGIADAMGFWDAAEESDAFAGSNPLFGTDLDADLGKVTTSSKRKTIREKLLRRNRRPKKKVGVDFSLTEQPSDWDVAGEKKSTPAVTSPAALATRADRRAALLAKSRRSSNASFGESNPMHRSGGGGRSEGGGSGARTAGEAEAEAGDVMQSNPMRRGMSRSNSAMEFAGNNPMRRGSGGRGARGGAKKDDDDMQSNPMHAGASKKARRRRRSEIQQQQQQQQQQQ